MRQASGPGHEPEQVGGGRLAVGGRGAAIGEQRGQQAGVRMPVGIDDHPREAWWQGQPRDRAASRREARRIDGAETDQQLARVVLPVHGRGVEPLEGGQVAAPRQDREQHRRQVDAGDVRLAERAQLVALVPEADGQARTEARGAPCPLVGRIGRDPLGLQRVQRTRRIVARDLLPAGVDHDTHARHRDRRLGDVGRQHDPPTAARRQRLVLGLRRECAVQRHHLRAVPSGDLVDLASRLIDLPRARKEAEHVADVLAQHTLDHAREGRVRGVLDGQRVGIARDGQDRAVVEEARYRSGIDGGRHHQHAQVVACQPRLPNQREAQIGMHAALVELVEDDRGDIGQQRVLLQARGQDAFGREEHACLAAEARFEAHVPAHLATERPALLLGDAPRQGPRGGPPRLQHQDRAVGGQHRRHAGRLAGTRCGHQHGSASCPQVVAQGHEHRIDGQRQHGVIIVLVLCPRPSVLPRSSLLGPPSSLLRPTSVLPPRSSVLPRFDLSSTFVRQGYPVGIENTPLEPGRLTPAKGARNASARRPPVA